MSLDVHLYCSANFTHAWRWAPILPLAFSPSQTKRTSVPRQRVESTWVGSGEETERESHTERERREEESAIHYVPCIRSHFDQNVLSKRALCSASKRSTKWGPLGMPTQAHTKTSPAPHLRTPPGQRTLPKSKADEEFRNCSHLLFKARSLAHTAARTTSWSALSNAAWPN